MITTFVGEMRNKSQQIMNIDPRFEIYCNMADTTNAGDALDRLIEIYINACGVSLGERSVAACACYYWIYRYKEEYPNLPESLTIKDVMALRSKRYKQNKESIDKYDIAYLAPKKILRVTPLMLDDYTDEGVRTALCMGILFYVMSLFEKETE